MDGRYAVDTSVVIAVLNDERTAAARWQEAEELLLPVPVLGELLFGARGSGKPADNERNVLELAGEMQIVPCDRAAAERYSAIKLELRRCGRPIPENDIWIAAICLARGATLATRDSHFEAVGGLRLEDWR